MANTNSQTKWMAAVAFTLVVAVIYWYSTQMGNTAAQAAPVAQAQNVSQTEKQPPMAPNFTLKNIEGKDVSLADYKGKVVFVNFWATWCPPCRGEIPDLIKLQDKYGKDGFAILGISVDQQKTMGEVPGFVKKMSMNYPVLYAQREVVVSYGGIESIPTTFVINRDGRALGKIVGARSYETFEKIILQSL